MDGPDEVDRANGVDDVRGYALGFIVSFTTTEEESSLQDILKTVSFKRD